MGAIADGFAQIYRDFVANNVPSTGAFEPRKSDIRTLGPLIEKALGAALGNVNVAKDTRANLNADLAWAAGSTALVYADGDADNIDLYTKSGAPGAGAWTNTGALHAILDAVAGPYVQATEAARDAALSSTFNKALVIGECTGAAPNSVNAMDTFGFGPHFMQRAQLTGIKVNTLTAGDFIFWRARRQEARDADAHRRVGNAITIAVPGGVHDITYEDIVAANGGEAVVFEQYEVLAWLTDAGVKYSITVEPYWAWGNGGNIMSTEGNATDLRSGASFDMECYFQLAAPENPAQYVMLEDIRSFSTVPDEWINTAGAFSNFGAGDPSLIFPNAGFANQLSVGKPYGLRRRIIQADFQFGTAGSHFGFLTDPRTPLDSGSYQGSMFAIHADINDVTFYGAYRAEGIPVVRESVPLVGLDGAPIDLVHNRTYTVTVEKDRHDYSVTITDPNGPTYFTHKVENGPFIYPAVGDPVDTRYGTMQGSPVFSCFFGSMKISNFRHYAPYRQFPAFYIGGDSLTEGFNVNNPDDTYAARLAALLGEDNVAISGVGGADTRGMAMRLFVECDHMRPQNVLLFLGSNPGDGAGFAANMAVLARMVRNLGANLLLGVSQNAERAPLTLAVPNATFVYFNKATSTDGLTSGSVAAFYENERADGTPVNDLLHVNGLGGERWYEQMLRDAADAINRARA